MSKDKIDPDSLREKNVTKSSSKVSQSTTERKRLVLTQKETTSSTDPKNRTKPSSNTLTKKTSVKSSVNTNKPNDKPKPARTSQTRQSSLDTPSSSSYRQVSVSVSSQKVTHQNQSKISNANVDMAIINSSIITPRKSVTSTPRKVSSTSSSSSKPQEKLSSRVTKEKYFPKGKEKTINGYKEEKQKSANDIKSAKKINLSRERTQTKITTDKRGVSKNDVPKIDASKSEVTLTRQKSRLERPTTSTIRRREKIDSYSDSQSQSEMSEVTTTISHASTIVKTVKTKNPPTDDYNDNDDNIYNYEDDFESYESDFEEYESSATPTDINTDTSSTESEIDIELKPKPGSAETSSDKEQKMDSGTYDLPELKHRQVLDRIKEAIEKENQEISSTILKNENSLNMASLSDEGFDEKFSMSNGFINFNTKSNKAKKKNPKNKRGDELMGMIRLDAVTYNLFDMRAISYDAFIKSYGKSGTVQVSSQTGDDNLDIEIQTDPIDITNKWTQFPIRIPKTEQNLPYNHLGVGGDDDNEQTLDREVNDHDIDSKKLDTFISYAGNLILNLLETKNTFEISKQSYSTTKSLPFADGFFKLNVEYEFLIGREVTLVEFSTNFLVLTVHRSNTEVYMNPDEQLLSRSLICIWSLLQPMHPQKILAASGEIRVACFDCRCGFLVFAGLSDGSVCVWDLREPSTYHRSVYEEKSDNFYTMRCPTYTTSACYIDDEIPTKIIAIKALNSTDENVNDNQQDVISMQICTLDELGTILIWSAIQRQNLATVTAEDQGLVPWGNIALVQSFTTNMQKMNPELKELHCYDLQCSNMDNNHLYIASNYGVLHCLTSGMKPKPKIYMAQTDASKSVCCIEMCPYSSTHFLAGSSDGCVRLHSRHYERALMNLRSVEENNQEEKVEIIQWSQSRPCVFYVKDSSNFVHVWDLLSSDMFPIYSIPFREEVTCIKLSPVQEGSQSYMAISTKKGSIFLHTINEKFGQSSSEQFTLELRTFLNYVNRL